jgi:N-acetylglucosamine kinase-like BadF-type ATPase
MSAPLLFAVDGGNSKTDLALLGADGEVRALVRGPLSSPHHLGLDGSLDVLRALVERAAEGAGVATSNGPIAEVAQLLMAGIDFPSEEQELRAAVEAQGWANRTSVGNDTFAVLRAGTEQGWGVAVVCGTGINCVGVAPDGRQARFPALGAITGDWGGGFDIGLDALSAAARSEDGRGPRTTLEHAVPAFFGFEKPSEVAEAIHRRQLPMERVNELAPTVFAEAACDEIAVRIITRLSEEVVALARVALERLELTDEAVDVLLGGGVLQAADGRLLDAIESGLRGVGPAIRVRPTMAPPIVGAALLALDQLGATSENQDRVREQLTAAVECGEAPND